MTIIRHTNIGKTRSKIDRIIKTVNREYGVMAASRVQDDVTKALNSARPLIEVGNLFREASSGAYADTMVLMDRPSDRGAGDRLHGKFAEVGVLAAVLCYLTDPSIRELVDKW